MGKHYGALIIESVLQLKKEGFTHREIGEKYGYTRNQIKELVKQYNKKQRMQEAEIVLKKKGRPSKEDKITDNDKISILKYESSRKDHQINRLKMENELLRDFLRLAGRK